MPKLRVTAACDLHPTSVVSVNSSSAPHPLHSDLFEGSLAVYIRDFSGDGEQSRPDCNEYFEERAHRGKKGLTWAIVVQGRFLNPTSSDDIVFGNIFDSPIRDYLPYGTSIALKALSWIDPPLEHDLYADKPWAMSPLLATMNFVNIQPHHHQGAAAEFPKKPIEEETLGGLAKVLEKDPKAKAQVQRWNSEDDPQEDGGVARRRAWFGKKANRDKVVLGPEDLVTTDFCNGYIDFKTLSMSMPSVHLSIPLEKYWDGQPIKYVCRSRDASKIYWTVSFEIIDENIKPVAAAAAAAAVAQKS